MAIPAEWKELAETARQAQTHSYSPYSKFRVGCALEDSDGRIFAGCNVENSNYSDGVCAERTAIVKMVSEGGKHVERVAIITDSKEVCFPCGACLQVLQEFGVPKVFSMNRDQSEHEEVGLEVLMPRRFTKRDLDGATRK